MTSAALLISLLLAQTPAAMLAGEVVDATGLALPGVVITVKGTTVVAVTDEHGRFSLAFPGEEAVLVFELPAFETTRVVVKPATPREGLHVVLTLAKLSNQVVVKASAADTPPDVRFPLRPLDVVRTAGAQADVMRALETLPGVTSVDEGAGLFVRGGDVSETLVMLDDVPVAHPYRYETPTGGFRGAVDPFLTQGVSFATGAFSAQYGDSLSGIVDMRGMGRPGVMRTTFTAGLAGESVSLAEPLGSKAGVRVWGNRATPSVLFAVNPSPREFDRLPGGWDLGASGHLDTTTRGSFRVFFLEQRDHVGVKLEKDAFTGFLHSGSRHELATLSWRLPFGNGWLLSAAGGGDRYVGTTDVGVFNVAIADRSRSARLDLGGPAGDWTLRFGADTGWRGTEALGQVPNDGNDFGGVKGTVAYDVSRHDRRSGGYLEVSHPVGRLTPTLGLRADYFSTSNASRVDPRTNFSYDLGRAGRLRFAWGLYHQSPSPAYFDDVRGAVTLPPMSATHYVTGYEIGNFAGAWFFRAEAYVKTYRDLPVQDALVGFAGTGYGRARGVDLFGRRVWHFIDVRAGISFVDARRRWTSPDQRDRYPLPAGTWRPDFDVPYTWNVVLNAPLSKSVSVGAAWHTAAGRPMTPVTGAIATASGYEPIWGDINSARLPHYQRVDLSFSWLHTFGRKTNAVFFASVDNVTARQNFFEYAYSADYSTRHPVLGASPRSVYFGCSFTR